MKLVHLSLLVGLSTTLLLSGCKKDEDPCENVVCANGGSCNDGSCTCLSGYEGSTCGTEVRAKFLGTYNVTEACPSGNFSYQITVTTSSAAVNRVIINNFGGYGVSVAGSVSGSSLTIANQQIDVGGTQGTFSGSGQLSGNILTITYTVSSGANSETCTKTCTKQ
ncbi:MAG: calcium-binding EGF-like domain-containing protein [Flavobacteriales bacterium]|nr:calcium-binding EGF-like domain-containing protein [Flavobacteriales bacterium]